MEVDRGLSPRPGAAVGAAGGEMIVAHRRVRRGSEQEQIDRRHGAVVELGDRGAEPNLALADRRARRLLDDRLQRGGDGGDGAMVAHRRGRARKASRDGPGASARAAGAAGGAAWMSIRPILISTGAGAGGASARGAKGRAPNAGGMTACVIASPDGLRPRWRGQGRGVARRRRRRCERGLRFGLPAGGCGRGVGRCGGDGGGRGGEPFRADLVASRLLRPGRIGSARRNRCRQRRSRVAARRDGRVRKRAGRAAFGKRRRRRLGGPAPDDRAHRRRRDRRRARRRERRRPGEPRLRRARAEKGCRRPRPGRSWAGSRPAAGRRAPAPLRPNPRGTGSGNASAGRPRRRRLGGSPGGAERSVPSRRGRRFLFEVNLLEHLRPAFEQSERAGPKDRRRALGPQGHPVEEVAHAAAR